MKRCPAQGLWRRILANGLERYLVAAVWFACALLPLQTVRALAEALPPQAPSVRSDADAAQGEQAPVRITTTVAPKDVTIGTPFRYTIRIESDPGFEVAVPLLADRLGEYAIVDFGHRDPVTDPDGTRVVEHWYDLVAYETGSRFVPGVPVAYKPAHAEPATVEAPKALVNVESLITRAGGADDIPAIREAVPIAAPGPRLWWLLAGAAVAASVGYLVYRWWWRHGAKTAGVTRSPHEIALEALQALRAEQLVEQGLHERYYVALSDIVRRYVEARFGLHAPEMTTDEFLAAAQRSRDLIAAHRSALQEFLVEADLVKFARHVPSREREERAWSAAHGFVAETRPPEVNRAAA